MTGRHPVEWDSLAPAVQPPHAERRYTDRNGGFVRANLKDRPRARIGFARRNRRPGGRGWLRSAGRGSPSSSRPTADLPAAPDRWLRLARWRSAAARLASIGARVAMPSRSRLRAPSVSRLPKSYQIPSRPVPAPFIESEGPIRTGDPLGFLGDRPEETRTRIDLDRTSGTENGDWLRAYSAGASPRSPMATPLRGRRFPAPIPPATFRDSEWNGPGPTKSRMSPFLPLERARADKI
jgi:hypothetical protein